MTHILLTDTKVWSWLHYSKIKWKHIFLIDLELIIKMRRNSSLDQDDWKTAAWNRYSEGIMIGSFKDYYHIVTIIKNKQVDSLCPSVCPSVVQACVRSCLHDISWTAQPFLSNLLWGVLSWGNVSCRKICSLSLLSRVYIIKLWLFLLYLLNCWSVCNQTCCNSTAS